MENKIKKIINSLGNSSGQVFFEKTALNLLSALKLDYIFISKLNATKTVTKTIAYAYKGKIIENVSYDLKDTPCENVSHDSEVCIIHDVINKYPKDKYSKELGMEAYIGAPLHNSSGEVFGLMVAMSEKEIKNSDTVETLFKLFSGRVSSEIERVETEDRLKELNNYLEINVLEKTEELKEAKKYYEGLVENLTDWVWEIDETASFTYCNKMAEKIMGYTAQEILGKKPFDFMDEDEIQRVGAIFGEIAAKKEPYLNMVNKHIHKDGSEVIMSVNGLPKLDAQGNLVGYRGVARDITAKIKRNNEKKQQDKKFLEQSRLAQMGEMISMIAHQWRQPLASIAATSTNIRLKSELEVFDMSKEKAAKDYESYVNKNLKDIENFVQNLTTTIDDFRNFYQPNKKSVAVNLGDVIDKAINIIKPSLINHNVNIIKEYNSHEEVEVFEGEVMQVVLNLLHNAKENFKEKQIKDRKIILKTENRTISVCDSGEGVPEDIINKIFDPYFSTKSKKNGTGLGLYMSKTIIEKHHNGKLNVRNTDDGVCFTIELGEISEKEGV